MNLESVDERMGMKDLITPRRLFALAAIIFLAEVVVAVFLYSQWRVIEKTPVPAQSVFMGDIQTAVPIVGKERSVELPFDEKSFKDLLNADGSFNLDALHARTASSTRN